MTTLQTTPRTMSPELQTIIDHYKEHCKERFLQATIIDGNLTIDYSTPGGRYARRTFFDPAQPDYHQSMYYMYWNENHNEPYGYICSRIIKP